MKNVKKCIVLLLIMLFLTACQSNKETADQNNQGAPIKGTETQNNQGTSEKENYTMGNANGNLHNGGFVAASDGWIYFALSDGIYKMKEDGSQKEKICNSKENSNALYLNVADDYVYFENKGVYKVKVDGSDLQCLYERITYGGVAVIDDWVYYSIENRFKKDGTSKQHLTDQSISPAFTQNYSDGWMYFEDRDENDEHVVSKMRYDGTEKHVIYNGKISNLEVYNGYLYYTKSDENEIWRMTTEGENHELILGKLVTHFIIDDDRIYYFSYNGPDGENQMGFLSANLDGSDKKFVLDKYNGTLNIIGDWIYYFDLQHMYRVKKDGTGLEEITGDNAKLSPYIN